VPTLNPIVVQLPPPQRRSRGLLVDVAENMSAVMTYNGRSRIGNGVIHTPWGCDPLLSGSAGPCDTDFLLNGDGPGYDAVWEYEQESAPGEQSANFDAGKATAIHAYPSTVEQPAFKVVDGLTCSTMSQPDDNQYGASMSNRLRRRMSVLMSGMLTSELITGWASGGISLSSEATVLTAATSMAEAGLEIEEHLRDTLQGQAGTVFIPPQLLHYAVEAEWVYRDGNRFYTQTGHSVVADAGHTGALGPATPSGGEFWLYAAGDIGYGLTDTILLGEVSSDTLDTSTNMRERLAEAYAQLVFDPCPVGAVIVDMGTGS
jgi:hypothetical protein